MHMKWLAIYIPARMHYRNFIFKVLVVVVATWNPVVTRSLFSLAGYVRIVYIIKIS